MQTVRDAWMGLLTRGWMQWLGDILCPRVVRMVLQSTLSRYATKAVPNAMPNTRQTPCKSNKLKPGYLVQYAPSSTQRSRQDVHAHPASSHL